MGLSSQSDHFVNFFGGGTCKYLTLFDEDVKLNSVVISDIDVIIGNVSNLHVEMRSCALFFCCF